MKFYKFLMMLLVFGVSLSSSCAHSSPNYQKLIQAATTSPWSNKNYPSLPPLSSEMQKLIVGEIESSSAVKDAYIKLDAQKSNSEWFQEMAELETLKAVWCLQSGLVHPSEDVQARALKSLKRIGDRRAIPFLLEYAEQMAVTEGGSENATVHGLLQESIAETLSTLTGRSLKLKA